MFLPWKGRMARWFAPVAVTNLDSPDSEMVYYVMLRAVDRFYNEYNRYPGFFEDQLETDISKLKVRVARCWLCSFWQGRPCSLLPGTSNLRSTPGQRARTTTLCDINNDLPSNH